MNHPLRIALASFDFPLGAVADNAARLAALLAEARDTHRAAIVVFPELSLSGSPALDLLSHPPFLAECRSALESLAVGVQGITAIVGWPCRVGEVTASALSVIGDGRILATALAPVRGPAPAVSEPACGVFEPHAVHFEVDGIRVGVAAGDDAAALQALSEAGVALVLRPCATAFAHDGLEQGAARLSDQAQRSGLALARINAIGAQDAWIFPGEAQLADGDGRLHPAPRAFQEGWRIADFAPAARRFSPQQWPTEDDPSRESMAWRALVAGLRGYVRRNGFSRALLGLSGGLDSALVLAAAVDALGAQNLTAVRLPSRHTSALSNDLAEQQAAMLGVRLLTLPIEPTVQSAYQTLSAAIGELPGLALENLQSRARGVLLMGLANAEGGLLLATGNKSESAVGYCTLYGDTCGGYAPLADLYKTEVYALARWRNARGDGAAIPQGCIDRAPSAELRDNQRDEDSLPPYPVLDALLDRHLEGRLSAAQLVEAGFEAHTVQRVLHLLRISEWKRAQCAPGPRLSTSAFGSVLQRPITSGYAG